MSELSKKFGDAPLEELKEMEAMLAGGASYYAVGKKFGYNRNTIRNWWTAKSDADRKKAALDNIHIKKEMVQIAFGTTDVETVSIDGKIDTAFERALEELIYRLSSETSKTMSDRDLISATKLLYDMRTASKGEEQPKVQNNTQNIINVFSEAIEESLKQHK
jgi:transposase-like protein